MFPIFLLFILMQTRSMLSFSFVLDDKCKLYELNIKSLLYIISSIQHDNGYNLNS